MLFCYVLKYKYIHLIVCEEENTCCLFLPAEPWGPVCSPGCWTLWSSRHRCRSQHLQSWTWSWEKKLRSHKRTGPRLIYASNVTPLTRLGRWSCPGRCEPPGYSSQLLYIWEYSSGWKPERVAVQFGVHFLWVTSPEVSVSRILLSAFKNKNNLLLLSTCAHWHTHLYQLQVLFTAANSHFGLQKLIESLMWEIKMNISFLLKNSHEHMPVYLEHIV